MAALVCLGAGGPGCRDTRKGAPRAATSDASRAKALNLAALGQDRGATLTALTRPYHAVASALGAHRLTCAATLGSSVGARKQKLRQKLVLSLDAGGGFTATKEIGEQQGQELIWTGGWLYSRLRYSRFTGRRPRPGEVPALMDRMAGLMPAYLGLLEPFLSLSPAGKGTHEGREGIKVKLGLKKPGPRAAQSGRSRRWRGTLAARSISGWALLDARTGAPLRVALKASWAFTPPPAGPLPRDGIPGQLDSKSSGTMELSYDQRVSRLGKVSAVAPPPADQRQDNVRRRRLDLERQIFTGEVPLPEDWRKVP